MTRLLLILWAVVVVGGAPVVCAQEAPPEIPADTAAADSTVVDTAGIEEALPPMDTVRYRRAAELDEFTEASDTLDLETRLYQNPTVALFKSAVVPGWGQFGNRRYIKGVIFLGLDIWMVASAIHYGRQASDFYDKFEAAETVSARNDYYDLYSDRRDNRNKYTWFAVIVSFVSMFDAYVDAHLSGFPEKERGAGFSVDVAPDTRGGFKASITVPF